MPATVKNRAIIEKYKEMIDVLYYEKDGRAVIGSFLHHTIDMNVTCSAKKATKSTSKKRSLAENGSAKKKYRESVGKDLRHFFKKSVKTVDAAVLSSQADADIHITDVVCSVDGVNKAKPDVIVLE